MGPAREAMKDALNGVKFQTPIVDVIANVTAKPVKMIYTCICVCACV